MLVAASNDGHPVFLTGQVAWDENEEIVGKGDIREQARQCFRNIENSLASVGGRIEDIVELTTYYTEPSQLGAIQQVRSEFIAASTAPASTSIMVAGLGHPDFLVEMTPVAIVPHDRFVG